MKPVSPIYLKSTVGIKATLVRVITMAKMAKVIWRQVVFLGRIFEPIFLRSGASRKYNEQRRQNIWQQRTVKFELFLNDFNILENDNASDIYWGLDNRYRN